MSIQADAEVTDEAWKSFKEIMSVAAEMSREAMHLAAGNGDVSEVRRAAQLLEAMKVVTEELEEMRRLGVI